MEKIFYKSIPIHTEFEISKIKGSRFIGNTFFITNKEEAEYYIKETSQKYKDASHNCFAYRYGTNINFDLFGNLEITPDYTKFNDDGEPSNTAGKPILSQIQGYNLHNILIIVTRYFGGTLLGVGGLIQAYSECAKQTINHSKIEEIELVQELTASVPYEKISLIMNLLNKYNAKILVEKHGNLAEIKFNINKGFGKYFEQELTDLSQGKIKIK